MRKFIFSLKALVMSLALVVGGNAWAQITSLPFAADFSEGPAPFGEPAFKTGTAAIGDVVAVVNGTAEATFAVGGGAYTLGNSEEVTVSFTMFNGWLGGGTDNTFAVLNSDGVALASISYNANNCNIVDVKLGGSTVEGFEAFPGQGKYNASKGSNGYTHSQTYVANTAEAKNNGEVTIKINSFGGISLAFVGGKGDANKFFSATAPAATKIDLAKLTISNGSNNVDRASGYGNLTVTSKSMVKYSNDFSDGVVTWTTATGGRYTPVILEEEGNKYLSVTDGERNNNGTTITSTETEGKVAAGEDFTMTFRVKLGASNDQTATAFNIFDAANSSFILNLAEVTANATAWTINGGTQTATVSAGGSKAIADLAWIDVKITSIAGGRTYLTLKDAEGEIIDGFDKTNIPTLSETGGLGKMNFPTSRYNANFAIDDIVVRDVVESEDIPATPVYNYTVMYKDQNGDPVKESVVREEYEGVELAILDEDKETVVVGKSQYTYVSDDAAGQTAASDGTTIVTVLFEKTTVADYTVNYLNGEGTPLKDAIVHKNVHVGTEVSASASEISMLLVDGTFYNYASGNNPITVAEDESQNIINLTFAPIENITGYFLQTYEDKSIDWTTATGGRYSPVNIDGSTIGSREQEISHTEPQPKVDPETGLPMTDPETGETIYEEVKVVDGSETVEFGNKTRFLTVNQAERNNNGVTNGVSTTNSFAVNQADFTFEAGMILGTSNNQGCSIQLKNFAGDANILQLIPTAVGSTTWVINGDAEKYAVELPGTGNFDGTGNDNLNNYTWYNVKVTVYNGLTFVTILDENGTAILDKAQVPTLATSYGVGKMYFYTGRYNSNFAIDNVVIRSVDTDNDVPADAKFVEVTINYKDDAGNVVKAAEKANFKEGAAVELNAAFIGDFKVDAEGNVWTAESESAPVTKYIYTENYDNTTVAAEDLEIDLVYRGVASRRVPLRYQYQTVDGTISSKTADGSNLPFFYDSRNTGDVLFEGDELTFYYPYYLLVDGLLYKTAANGSGTDKGTLVIEPGTTTQINYPQTWTPAMETVPVIDPETGEQKIDPETGSPVTEEVQISNAVFASETENIEGITVVKDGYTNARMANGAAGSAIGSDIAVTTLEPGKYKLTTATRSGTTNFTVNDEVVATISSSGTTTTITSDEFTVGATSTLYIQQQSGTTQYSDYVLIRKTGDVETIAITVADNIENGTVEVPASAAPGTKVTPAVTPAEGYVFSALTVTAESGAPVEVTEGSFIMPAEAVTVSATFDEIPFEPVDYTAKVSTDAWQSEVGGVGNYTKDVAQKEQYLTNTTTNGEILFQTVNELENGTYTVELYANASYTAGRGFASDANDGDLGRAIVYAGDVEQTIPVIYQTAVGTNNIVKLENVVVSDGTLKIGLRKNLVGSNWHTIQIKSLTQTASTAKPDEAAQDTYWKGVAAQIIEANPLVAGSEKANLEAADSKAAVQSFILPFYEGRAAYVELANIIKKAEEAGVDVSEAQAIYESGETTAEEAEVAYHAVNLAINTKAVEGASDDNPIQTTFVVNGTFDTAGVTAPWKTTTGAQNQTTATNQQGAFTVPFFENWNPNPFSGKLYQTIEDIPNGIYTLKMAAFVNTFAGEGQTSQYIYAGDNNKTYITAGEPTAYEVPKFVVEDNKIEIGFEQSEAVANWVGIDNVSLVYYGPITFDITVAPYENGTVEAPEAAAEGAEVAVTITPAEGYEFVSIAVTGTESNEAYEVEYYPWDGAYFTMPAEAVTINVAFQEAYVTLSDFAIVTDGAFDEEDNVKFKVTYKAESVGEPVFPSVAFSVKVYSESGLQVYEGDFNTFEDPIEGTLEDGAVVGNVPNLAGTSNYTIVLDKVVVYDFSMETFDIIEVFSQESIDDTPIASFQFTTGVPTGINAVPEAAEGVKADGKYLEDGKIVIYKNGIKYNAAGALIR